MAEAPLLITGANTDADGAGFSKYGAGTARRIMGRIAVIAARCKPTSGAYNAG